jgi:DNA-binding PadR family transcriptional regulator
MYRDNTLIPAEAVRLAALGSLVDGDKSYGDLAREIRFFVARIVGPSLDLLGTSLELLRLEGLIEALDGTAATETLPDEAMLRITDEGKAAFHVLMTSNVRGLANDLSRLVIALKMRFLQLLSEEDRHEQAEIMAEAYETELARLQDLRGSYGNGYLAEWLDHEIAEATERRDWFTALDARI